MRLWKFSSKLSRKYNQTIWRVSKGYPGSVLTHVFFPTHLLTQRKYRSYSPCFLIHAIIKNPPAHRKRTAAQRLPPFTERDVTRQNVHVSREESTGKFPGRSRFNWTWSPKMANALCMFDMFSSKRMPSRFRSLLAKEMRLKLKAKKGSNADGMRLFISQFSYLVATH